MFAAVMAAIASASHAQTQAQTPKPAQIDRNGVLILIRSSLLALDHANNSGNYTVLHDLARLISKPETRRPIWRKVSPICDDATLISLLPRFCPHSSALNLRWTPMAKCG